MRKPMAKKVLAATMAAAMTMSVVACGGNDTSTSTSTSTTTSTSEVTSTSTEEEVSPYTILKDKDGNVYDFGGIEVDMLDWWSPVDGSVAAPNSAYEEAVQEYHAWLQETYNFTFKQMKAYEWGDAPAFLSSYNETPDDRYLILIEREDPATTAAVGAGMVQDLSKLGLDFSRSKFDNGIHKGWSIGGGVYAMASGIAEPRCGVFFNKKVLRDAKIDPESIYDMVDAGTWTFDALEELCATVQRDTDGDDVIDVYGLCANWGDVYTAATFANGGTYIEQQNGKWVVTVGSDNTRQALEWTQRMQQTYNAAEPEGAAWDFYKQNFTLGHVAFMPEGVYNGYPNGALATEELADEEYGFVVFPKGPSADGKYTNLVSENLIMIPGVYDVEKATKIATIWNLWTETPKGFEDVNGYLDNCRNGIYDERALENVELMMAEGHKEMAVHNMLPGLNIGPDFLWTFWQPVSTVIENVTPVWQALCDAANK